jgi:small-conductance mechanosensitive channel
MADANQLVQAVGMVGGTFTGIVAVIVAWGKAREMANKPLEDLKASLTTQITGVKTDLTAQINAGQVSSQASHSNLDAKMTALRRDVDAINVHFDPNGANIRGKLTDIERRLASLETATTNERAELKGLLTDLRPIIHELRERL